MRTTPENSWSQQGKDGYFDVKCFDGQAHACADYLKAGREVAIDGRLHCCRWTGS